jgi:predicted choloylglycine hydrolase
MPTTKHRLLPILVLTVAALTATAPVRAQESEKNGCVVQDRIIAGSPSDFLEVRHLVLKGTNREIGEALAKLARDRYSVQLERGTDPLRTRAQRHYLEKNAPALYERMKGVAAAYGKSLEDDTLNFSGLGFPPLGAGCSVVYYPPTATIDGKGIISRNYDFTTGTFRGTRPGPGELASTARPYLVEMYPDQGYASIGMVAYDLLTGVIDGMNSEGLTVALLADDELHQKYKMEPTHGNAVGLGSLQMQRLLLDTCASVEEAKTTLLMTKQYYEFLSVHYLVADRHGKSFVWEYSQAHNKEYIVENDGKPLITTNFSLHKYLEGRTPPSTQKAASVCPRYCALAGKISEHPGKVSADFIKATHKLVDATRPGNILFPPGRTLWHALYFPEDRKLQINFCLRDEPDASQPAKIRIVRSDYLEFGLQGQRVTKR